MKTMTPTTKPCPPRIDPAAIRCGTYWTVQSCGGVSDAAARRYRIEARPQETPHESIAPFACKSPKSLLRMLRARRAPADWKQAHFNHTSRKIARVKITPDGFIFTAFDTYNAACKAHKLDHA